MAAGAREVPGLASSLAVALRSWRRAATFAAKFPHSYLGAGRGGNCLVARGGAGLTVLGQGEEGPGGAGAERTAARGRWWRVASLRAQGCRELLGYRSVGIPQEPRERRTRATCGGSWPPSPAAGSPPLYRALWHNYCRGAAGSGALIGSQQPSPMTGSEKFPSLTPPSRRSLAYSRVGFSFSFCNLSAFLGVRGGPGLSTPLSQPGPAHLWPPEPPKRSSSSAQNPPLLPAPLRASLNSFSQRSSQTYPQIVTFRAAGDRWRSEGGGRSSHLPHL